MFCSSRRTFLAAQREGANHAAQHPFQAIIKRLDQPAQRRDAGVLGARQARRRLPEAGAVGLVEFGAVGLARQRDAGPPGAPEIVAASSRGCRGSA
jgi:hypothetical protein